MKSIVSLLFMVLLASACLSSAGAFKPTTKMYPAEAFSIDTEPQYIKQGNYTAYSVKYHWIIGVDEGDLVLLNIQADTWPSSYESVLHYSNMTPYDGRNQPDTHVYEFIADKTDSYLLRLYAGFSFNYTIECEYHPISSVLEMNTKPDDCVALDPEYYWFSVGQDALVLLNIQADTWPSSYESMLYYSNLTFLDSRNHPDTHVYQFIADKTDNYLLRLQAGFSFNLTIECNKPIQVKEQPMYAKSDDLTVHDVDYFWIGATQGSLVLLNIQADTWPSSYESMLYYSNLTFLDGRNQPDTHIYEFIADKTDSYLLRLYAGFSFNYTIECNQPITDQPVYTKRDNYTAYSVKYHWIIGVDEGDLVLLNIQADTWPSSYESMLYYSNLTFLDSRNHPDTHVYQFIADKTDNYLLRLQAGFSFSYAIESTHPIDSAPQRNATQIVFALRPNPATVGKRVTLQGNLTSNGNPIPGAKVTIKLGANGVGDLTTNSTGWFEASGSVPSAGTFNITVEYAGSEQYLPNASWAILVVVKEVTRIYCRIDPNPVSTGNNYIIEGILVNNFSQPIAGATVKLYKRPLSGSWTYVTSVTTDSYGIFRWQGTASTVGTFIFAAYYEGSTAREASLSYAIQIVQ